MLALIAAVLDLVSPAGALSPINHAPVAAAQSRSVRFSSELEVAVNGRRITHFTEHGELNFATGDYATALNPSDTDERIERRRVGDVFYGVQLHPGARASSTRWRAIGVAGRPRASVLAPGGYSLIDPQVVFRVLAGARSPVMVVGHEKLDGTPTTHYRLSTSLAAFLSAEQSSLADVSRFEGVDATLDVWLDGQGRPKRVAASFAGESRLGNATMTTIVDFTDYGLAVTVRPPSNVAFSPRSNTPSFGALGGDPLLAVELLLFARR